MSVVIAAMIVAAPIKYSAGYSEDAALILQKTFVATEGYDEMVVLRGIRFGSHCGHRMAPIMGQAWVADANLDR